MKTSKHRFMAFSRLGAELDCPACRDELSSLDCGGCVASHSDTLSLFVTWHLQSLDEANTEGASIRLRRRLAVASRQAFGMPGIRA